FPACCSTAAGSCSPWARSRRSASRCIDMGWLNDLTNWLAEQLTKLWEAIETFFTDLLVALVETVLEAFALIVELIPVPDFLTTYSLCNLLGMAGPEVGYFLQTFRIGEALGLIAAGYAFRLTRKLVTAGQW